MTTKRTIKKVAVLGSGVMGSRIACHFANIGVQVLLLDPVRRATGTADLNSEKEVRESKNPNGPFVAVTRNGELLPEVKQVLAIIAAHNLVLASGHIAPEDALSYGLIDQIISTRKMNNASVR